MDSGNPQIIYPDIALAVDDQDCPYGITDSRDGDGYLKPTHLPSHPVVVQQQGVLVGTFVAQNVNQSATSLATNIILPLLARNYSLNGNPVDIADFRRPNNVTMAVGDVFGVQAATSAIVIKLLFADSCGNNAVKVVYQSDKFGLPYNATRLTAYHFKGAPVSVKCVSKTIFAILVGDSRSEEEFVALLDLAKNATLVQNSFSNGNWNVTATVDGSKYSIIRNVNLSNQPGGIISRKINGIDFPAKNGVYFLNGVDMAPKILG